MKEEVLKILIILLVTVSCKESKNRKEYWDIPNSKTKTEIIYTVDKQGDNKLFSKFNADIKQEKFKIENIEMNSEMSYNDCIRNVILTIKGQGIRKYYIKRQEAKPKNFYPDFILWVYEFDNEEQAQKVKNLINDALKSGSGFCNGKDPKLITKNGNKVFYLSTRAEMFRSYIINFGKKIENYH